MDISKEHPTAKYIFANKPRTRTPKIIKEMMLSNSPADKYEMEIWQLFYNMGATYLGVPYQGEKLKFNFSSQRQKSIQESRQVDVFAVVRDYAIVVECTTSKQKKEIDGRVLKIANFRSAINKEIDKLFPNKKLKKIHIMASNNYSYDNEKARELSKQNQIIFLRNKEYSYLQDVWQTSACSVFAFNQFLGFFRKNEKSSETLSVDALRTKLGKGNYSYTFTLSPDKLLPISNIAHRRAKDLYEHTQSSDYYQRLLTKNRLKKIKEHIEKGEKPFVNNILASYRGKGNLKQAFKQHEKSHQDKGGSRIKKMNDAGTLDIPNVPGCFHIIDGQHRLFGYSDVKESLRSSHELVVTAFDGIDIGEEANYFVTINNTQKAIDASLLAEVKLINEAEDVESLATHIALECRSNENSPFLDPKVISDTEKNNGVMKITAIRDALKPSRILATDPKRENYITGYGFKFSFFETRDRIAQNIFLFFQTLKENLPEYWIAEKGGKTILKQNMVHALLLIFDRMIDRDEYARKTKDYFFYYEIEEYIKAFCRNFKKLPEGEIKNLTNMRHFLGGTGPGRLRSSLLMLTLKEDYPQLIDEKTDKKLFNEYKQEVSSDELLKELKGDLKTALTKVKDLEKEIEKERQNQKTSGKEPININIMAQKYEEALKTLAHHFLVIVYGENYWLEKIDIPYKNKHIPEAVQRIEEMKAKFRDEGRKRFKYDMSFANLFQLRLILKGLSEVDSDIKPKIAKFFTLEFPRELKPHKFEKDTFYYLILFNVLRRFGGAGHMGVAVEDEIDPTDEEEIELFNSYQPKLDKKIQSLINFIESNS